MIGALVESYERLKVTLVPSDEDLRALLHIHFGLACWLLLLVALRREMTSLGPIAIVWALCLLGEAADLYDLWPIRYDWIWRDTAGDIFNTLVWPTALWLFACWRAWLKDRAETRHHSGPAALIAADSDVVDLPATIGDEDR